MPDICIGATAVLWKEFKTRYPVVKKAGSVLYCGYPLVVIIVPIAHWSMYYFIGREEGKIMWKVRAKKWYEKFVAVEDKKKLKRKCTQW